MFFSQEFLKTSAEEDELPTFQKPCSPGKENTEMVEDNMPESPSIVSPAFQLTALENMDGVNKYNWSAPSTPSKDFLSPKLLTPVRAIPQLVSESPIVCSQELENLCSGQFPSQLPQETEDNSQDFQLFLEDDSQLMQDDVTPLKTQPTSEKLISNEKNHTRAMLDDDDEFITSVTSKRAKKLNFSDDEDDSDSSQKVEENVESDVEENDELEEGNESTAEDVAYDSEENEVVKTVGDFLDKEAELSDSEWSSEDEDEQGLDTLEMEEADRENIDQRKLRRQLGQIHMKQMLIEDKKEVRLLQEMLLEDGELHSESKRQRLFRWSNNTFEEGDNKASLDSDEDKAEEDEDEENWRRLRHEREQFLKEHSKKLEKLETLEETDSQVLKLGQKALKRLSSNSQEPKLTPPADLLASPDSKKPYSLVMKRGSFLSRGQQVLSRLAQIVSTTSDGPIQQPKNSRNFVFASISPTKEKEVESKPILVSNKRKLPQLPLPIAKKSCVQKPKTANRRSLFEALSKVQS